MPRVVAKSKRNEAERASEWALHDMGFTHTRRALRLPYNKTDLFGCDVLGMAPTGQKAYVQVTAGQSSAMSKRRRKLERYPWAVDDYVAIWQLKEVPGKGNRKLWSFRVNVYQFDEETGERKWLDMDHEIPIKSEWFKAMPKEETGGYEES
jgi:hypothetical protein